MGISQNIIDVTNKESHVGPIIFNCSTNGERSNLVAIGLTALQALKTKQPVIASNNKLFYVIMYNLNLSIQIFNRNYFYLLFEDVSDIWFRICSQRKGALKDLETYHLSMQIVLLCCREFLKMSM